MEDENRIEEEGAAVRLGAPVLSTVLLVVMIGAIFVLPAGPARTTTLLVTVLLQVIVMLTRAMMLRRAARPVDWRVRWHQFTFMWGTTTGVYSVIDTLGDDAGSTPSALVVVGQQLLVAIFVVVVLWLNEDAAPPQWWPRRWWPRRRRAASDDPEQHRRRTVQLSERPSSPAPPNPAERRDETG